MTEHRLADDLIRGAKQIGEELGLSPTQVFYLHKQRLLPTFVIGTAIHARKSKLREYFAKLEATQQADMVA